MKEPLVEVLKAARQALIHFTGAWQNKQLPGPVPVDPVEVINQLNDLLTPAPPTSYIGGITAKWVGETEPPPPRLVERYEINPPPDRKVNFREFL